MAKKGGFGRFLDIIGLVEDKDPQDTRDNYDDGYRADDYGRQQAYTPSRQQSRPQTRQSSPMTRRGTQSYTPTRPPRMDRNGTAQSRSSTTAPGRSDSTQRGAQTPRRTAPAQSDRQSRYDYTPRTSRFGSLEDAPADTQRSAGTASRGGASRQRTVMFTLYSLTDCGDVIDNLVTNNTVVLTLGTEDPVLRQRAVDTVSGAVFALHADIRKASENTYLIAPASVEVNENRDRY